MGPRFLVNTALPTLKTISTEALLGSRVLYFMNTFLIDGVSFNDKRNLLGTFDKYMLIFHSFSIEISEEFLFDHGKKLLSLTSQLSSLSLDMVF